MARPLEKVTMNCPTHGEGVKGFGYRKKNDSLTVYCSLCRSEQAKQKRVDTHRRLAELEARMTAWEESRHITTTSG